MATAALDAALSALRDGSGGPAAIRAASRAADDAEIAALEASISVRAELMGAVHRAREEIVAFRSTLRRKASEQREELVKDGGSAEDLGSAGAAEAVARDINDSLRRSTGVVTQEVARSHAAGHVVDASGRTLRKTRDTHKAYGDGLKEGRDVLGELARAERRANVVLVVSLAFFVLVVCTVAARRLQRSTTATGASLLVRPIFRVAMLPLKAGKKVGFTVRALLRKRDKSKLGKPKRNRSSTHLASNKEAAHETVRFTNELGRNVQITSRAPRIGEIGMCGLVELHQCSRSDWLRELLSVE